LQTRVTFESSAFNTTETKEYFINPACFGDDLAKWFIAALRNAGLSTDAEPGQEDFGWYFEFSVPEGRHCVVMGFRPGDTDSDGCWMVWLERSRGLLGSLLGGRQRGIAPSAIAALDRALRVPEIRNVQWHDKKDF
jgi:hypothetical protein